MPTGLTPGDQAKSAVPSYENARSVMGALGGVGAVGFDRLRDVVEITAEKALETPLRLTDLTRRKFCVPGVSVKNVAEVASVVDESVSEKKLSEETCATYTVSGGLPAAVHENTALVMWTGPAAV